MESRCAHAVGNRLGSQVHAPLKGRAMNAQITTLLLHSVGLVFQAAASCLGRLDIYLEIE